MGILASSEGEKLGHGSANHSDAEAHYKLGMECIKKCTVDGANEAIKEFEEAIRINPNYASAHLEIASLLLFIAYVTLDKANILDKVIRASKEAIRIDPNLANAHARLGEAYSLQGKLDEAITEFREAIRIHPNDSSARYLLGRVYREQGKLDEAVTEFREAIRINPNYASAHINLGAAYDKQGKLDEAVTEFREAIRINPNYASAHINLGAAYDKQGKLDEACREFREAMRDYSGSWDQYELDKVMNVWEEDITKLEPNDAYPGEANMHTCLGYVYREQGKLDEAVTEFREAIRLDPNDESARAYLGCIYHEQGKLDEAITEFREAIRLDPTLDHASDIDAEICTEIELLSMNMKFPE